MKTLFQTLYQVESIIQLKNSKLRKTFIVFIIYTLLLNFGLALSVIKMNTIDPTMFSKEIYQRDIMENIPNCQVIVSQLICESDDVFIQEFDNFNFVINPSNNDTFSSNKTNILFLKDEISIINKDGGKAYHLGYKQFNDVNFNQYRTMDSKTVIDDITQRLFLSVKPYLLLPMLLTVYLVLIIFNFVFVSGLAGLSLLLNLGNKSHYNYKQALNLVVYSSLIPIVLSSVVSLVISPIFGVVIYNFSLALFFLYVNKIVIKGNFS